MVPPESTARTNKAPRQGRRTRPQGIVEANRKTEICKHWLQGACPFGAKCAFAHGAHELRPLTESSHGAGSKSSYKMAKTDHRLQTVQIETEGAPGEARRASPPCCDPRCTFHHGPCTSLNAGHAATVRRLAARHDNGNPSNSNGNGGGGIHNNTNANMFQQPASMSSMFSSSAACTAQRSPLQELDSNGRGCRAEEQQRPGLLYPWASPCAILQSSSLGWPCPTGTENSMAAAAAAAVGGGASQLSAFHKANPTTTNSNSSNYSAASSATAAGGSTQGEGETWANVVARRNSKSRRSFTTTSDAPPVSSASAPLAMPMPVALPGVEDRGVSAVVPASSSSACGRKDCPCCASHAAAAAAAGAGGPGPATPGGTSGFSLLGGDLLDCTAVTPPTAAGPSSSCSAASTAPTEATTPAPWSSSSSSSPPSASSGSAPSRWSSTVRSLFTTPPATEAKTAAAPPPQASQSAGRGRDDPSSSNREEDANRAVASMMAALSLDDDGDEEEDDELVGLSMKPATWGALPSFLLAEEGEEEDGSLLPRASQLSNSLHSLSTQSSSDRGGTDDAGTGMGPVPGFREQGIGGAPCWTTPADEGWQPRLPDAPSPKDGLFQVITPLPGFDFGWGPPDFSMGGASSATAPKDAAAFSASRPTTW